MSKREWQDDLEFSDEELSELESVRENRSSVTAAGRPRRRTIRTRRRSMRVPAEVVPRKQDEGEERQRKETLPMIGGPPLQGGAADDVPPPVTVVPPAAAPTPAATVAPVPPPPPPSDAPATVEAPLDHELVDDPEDAATEPFIQVEEPPGLAAKRQGLEAAETEIDEVIDPGEPLVEEDPAGEAAAAERSGAEELVDAAGDAAEPASASDLPAVPADVDDEPTESDDEAAEAVTEEFRRPAAPLRAADAEDDEPEEGDTVEMRPEERNAVLDALEAASKVLHKPQEEGLDSRAFDVHDFHEGAPGATEALEELSARHKPAPAAMGDDRTNRVSILLSALRAPTVAKKSTGTPAAEDEPDAAPPTGQPTEAAGAAEQAAAPAAERGVEESDAPAAKQKEEDGAPAKPQTDVGARGGELAAVPSGPFPLAADLVAPPLEDEEGEAAEEGEDASEEEDEVDRRDTVEVDVGEEAGRVGAGSLEEISGDDLEEVVEPPPLPDSEAPFEPQLDEDGEVRVIVDPEAVAPLREDGIMTSAPPDAEIESSSSRSLNRMGTGPHPLPPEQQPPPAPEQPPPPAPEQQPLPREATEADAPPAAPASAAERAEAKPPADSAPAAAAEQPAPAKPREETPPAARAEGRRRSKAWFEEIFGEDYLRTVPPVEHHVTVHEVDFIEQSLHPMPESRLIDLGCGTGRHAIELAARGYQVTGLDLSLQLLIRAADEAQRRGLTVKFVHSDFREINFESEFDAAFCVNTSFGFFDDDSNRKMIQAVNRALRAGGRLLLEVVNRDYVVRGLPARIWWEADGCVVLEEVDFNYFTSRVQSKRSIVYEDGRHVEQQITIRCYTLHELGKLLHHAGFRVLEVSGNFAHRTRFFGNDSRSLILLAEKRR